MLIKIGEVQLNIALNYNFKNKTEMLNYISGISWSSCGIGNIYGQKILFCKDFFSTYFNWDVVLFWGLQVAGWLFFSEFSISKQFWGVVKVLGKFDFLVATVPSDIWLAEWLEVAEVSVDVASFKFVSLALDVELRCFTLKFMTN